MDAYIRDKRGAAAREMKFYAGRRTLAHALEAAAGCLMPDGKRHPHRHIPGAALQEASQRLHGVDLAAERIDAARRERMGRPRLITRRPLTDCRRLASLKAGVRCA
ncbi:MAG: hypothetical protein AB7O97_08685 [Planctomycetota bacterium]